MENPLSSSQRDPHFIHTADPYSGRVLLMSRTLPSGAQRVQDFLLDRGSHAHVQLLPETTATARDAATALGVEVHQIGKSIVFGASDRVIVAVLCGDQRVDTDALARALGETSVVPMKAEGVRERTGFVIGGVSPFALPNIVRIILDSRLYAFPACYVAAGHPKAVVLTNGEDLVSLTSATVQSIAVNL